MEAGDGLGPAKAPEGALPPHGAAAAPAPPPKMVEVTLHSDATVSYASYQNAIPLVHEILITNHTESALHQVDVVLFATPDFAEPLRFRFERLESGAQRRIAPVDLKLRHKFLSELTEADRGGRLRIMVRAGQNLIASVEAPVEVMAYDQWGGTRAIPELLVAFSQPNNPAVDRLLHDAAKLLSARGASISGYDHKSRDDVWAQVSAAYSAVAARGLQYSLPPASFAEGGQKIRTADRILEGGVGTCLDLTMLLVSCLEQMGLNPLVLLQEGHSWVGCWLVNTCFPTCVVDDAQAVRKRVATGEMLAFETTGLTHRPLASLRAACESGRLHLHDESTRFVAAIDVRRARQQQIQPLPSKGQLEAAPLVSDVAPPMVEPAPVLPPLTAEPVLLDEHELPNTPEGRLGRWQSKLLDLTLRNRMLNFKPSRSSIPLVVPDPEALEDALASGAEWKLRSKATIMEGADPRHRDIARQRAGGDDPVVAMARDAMQRHELLSPLELKKLENQLYDIYLDVRTAFEEGGANTLFLAVGFLSWSEDERSEKNHLAPILLIPVTLNRASVRAGFSISSSDDETMVNQTLLQMLREVHGIELRGLDPLPTHEKGVDVSRILGIFREAAKEIPRWEVIPDVSLGVFSFTKFLLWKDLRDRNADLRRNRVVGHLIDHARESMEAPRGIADRDDLDERHPPGTLLAPLEADASQLNVVSRASSGQDFLVYGPPGTGKSQTLVNLIAHALGTGKTVLFVSEKIAALSVVQQRLQKIGLGRFCLELHSAKARKADVLEQLRQARDITLDRSAADWEIESERLARLRAELNNLARALHREYPNGFTVRGALDKAIAHPDWQSVPIELPSIDTADRRQMVAIHEVTAGAKAVLAELAPLHEEPLRGILHEEWTHAWEEQLLAAGEALAAAAQRVDATWATTAAPLSLPGAGLSLRALDNAEALADVLLRSRDVPPGLAGRADQPVARNRVAYIREHGQRRAQAWGALSDRVAPTGAQLSGAALQQQWQVATAQWWLPRILGQSRVIALLMPHWIAGGKPLRTDVPALLDALVGVNQEDDALRLADSDARDLLGDSFQGASSDWAAVMRAEAWAKGMDAVLQRFESLEHPEDKATLTARVRTLLTDQRSLLAAGGPLTLRLVAFREAMLAFRKALDEAQKVSANPHMLGADSLTNSATTRAREAAQRWQLGRERLRQWCKWRGLRAQALQMGLARVVERLESGALASAQFPEYVDFAYSVWWLKGVMDREPVLRTFSSADHERKIAEFRQADQRFQSLTERYIFAKLAAGVPDADGARKQSEMGVLNREIEKKQRHLAVRKLFQTMPTLLPRLKPCLLMSPLSVAQYLDPAHPPFDLVLMDEASQMTTADAVGAIARGTQLIVIGDPQQLPPTDFFAKKEADDDGAADETEGPVKDLDSILEELMASGMARLSLDFHYRSSSESLIHFSNTRYYESRLITFPAPSTRDDAVRLIPVNGIYARAAARTNRAEADAVVARIVEHFSQEMPAAKRPTMGVICFNLPQTKLISKLLDEQFKTRPEIEARINEQKENDHLMIRNLEQSQGDERDIMLFSTTFARDAAGHFPMYFGPIGQEGGHRRLNVAVTRARDQIEIYSSMGAGDIDLARTRARGVVDLKAYLDYAARGAKAIAEESVPTGREPESPFEQQVIQVLRNAGWQVHPQVGVSAFRIDMAVVDRGQPGRYLVGIEADGATYHRSKTARDRDRLRQANLERLGWKLLRVWSTDWWTSRQRTAKALLDKVSTLQAEADAARKPADAA